MDYKEFDNAFTGEILKVTVDMKPIGSAVKTAADRDAHGRKNSCMPRLRHTVERILA